MSLWAPVLSERVPSRATATTGAVFTPRFLVLAGVLTVAALSLLGPARPTYDPWAWLTWGREITEGELVTTAGPSWKPLPVLFTTPLALLGDDAAPALWLLLARTGGVLSIVRTWRLAARFAGWPAGLIAAAGLVICEEYVRHFLPGNSEGILVALCLYAVERHLDGRYAVAFALAFGAALLRPEIWPFFGVYGLWLVLRDPRWWRLVFSCFAATSILWFVPEYIGSGDFLRAAERARSPAPGSPAFAAHPFLEVLQRASGLLAPPVLVGAGVAVVLAIKRGRSRPDSGDVRTIVLLAGSATALILLVALMTQAGFAGNLRYLALPAALVCVLAGIGWARLVSEVAERRGLRAAWVATAVLVAGSIPFALSYTASLDSSLGWVKREAAASRDLSRAIAQSGGAAAAGCGGVYTGPYTVQLVAWELHRHGSQVGLTPRVPGTIYNPRGSSPAQDRRFTAVASTQGWTVARACGS